jgi:hypothetical protein
MADDLKIPSFTKTKVKKVKEQPPTVEVSVVEYVPLTDEQIEACRKGQDIFDFARDIEEVIRVNNKI